MSSQRPLQRSISILVSSVNQTDPCSALPLLEGALYGAAGDLIGEVDEGDFGRNRPILHGDYHFAIVSDEGHLDDRFGIVEGSGSGDVLLDWGFDDPDPALSLIEVNHTFAARESLVVKFTLGPAVSSAVPEPTGFAGFASVGCLIHRRRRSRSRGVMEICRGAWYTV